MKQSAICPLQHKESEDCTGKAGPSEVGLVYSFTFSESITKAMSLRNPEIWGRRDDSAVKETLFAEDLGSVPSLSHGHVQPL